MRKLSTGDDSTLGNWRKLSASAFGEGSPQVAFFDEKIKEQGENEEVVIPENQLLLGLLSMDMKLV